MQILEKHQAEIVFQRKFKLNEIFQILEIQLMIFPHINMLKLMIWTCKHLIEKYIKIFPLVIMINIENDTSHMLRQQEAKD